MSAVALDKQTTTGHGNFPPSVVQSTASKVLINGKPPILDGDQMQVHCDPNSCHDSVAVATTSKVYVNGKKVVMIGDKTSCGDTISEGSSDVFMS